MNRKNLLFLEATILSAPCILISMGGLPLLLFSSIRQLSEAPLEAILVILGVYSVAYSLIQFWVLTHHTAHDKKYYFGLYFWLALPGAILGVRGLFGGFFELHTALIISVSILFAIAHFIFLQIRKRPSKA